MSTTSDFAEFAGLSMRTPRGRTFNHSDNTVSSAKNGPRKNLRSTPQRKMLP
jgi:hypothetical protein